MENVIKELKELRTIISGKIDKLEAIPALKPTTQITDLQMKQLATIAIESAGLKVDGVRVTDRNPAYFEVEVIADSKELFFIFYFNHEYFELLDKDYEYSDVIFQQLKLFKTLKKWGYEGI